MLFDYMFLQWAEIIGALSTLILVYLYWKIKRTQSLQTQIQERQTKIMERQNRLMAASHKPDIRIDFDKTRVTNNKVIISITNLGNDSARNLQIRCDSRCIPDSPEHITLGSSSNRLRRSHKSRNQSMSEVHSEETIEPDDTILAGEQGIKFNSTVSLPLSSKEEKTMHTSLFDQGITELVESGVEEISIHLFLEFEDIAGEHDEKEIYTIGCRSKIEEGMSLQDVVDCGNQSATAGTVTVKPQTRTQRIQSWLDQLLP